jgi:hypothetical protein
MDKTTHTGARAEPHYYMCGGERGECVEQLEGTEESGAETLEAYLSNGKPRALTGINYFGGRQPRSKTDRAPAFDSEALISDGRVEVNTRRRGRVVKMDLSD